MKKFKKNVLTSMGVILMVAAPIAAVVSCSTKSSNFADSAIKDFKEQKMLSNEEGTQTINSRPSTNVEDEGKQVITLGVASNQESIDKNNDGKWKIQGEVRGASDQALIDLINNYNKTNTDGVEIKMVSYPGVGDISTLLSAKNTKSSIIPNVIFDSRQKLASLKQFKDAFENIDNSNNKYDIVNSSDISKMKSTDFLPIAESSLVGIIDYKLLNGLIYSYNKHLNKLDGTKIYDKNYNLVGYTEDVSDYTSTGYAKNGKSGVSKTMMNLTFDSNLLGDEPLSYDRLSNDMDLWMKIKDNWSRINSGIKNTFGSDFNGELLYSLANIKSDKKIISEDGEIIKENNLQSAYDSLVGNYKAKTGSTYNTPEFEKANLLLDITKGYSLNYYLDNENIKYMAVPGINYLSEKGFSVIEGKQNASFDNALESFFNYIYKGTFINNKGIYNKSEGEGTFEAGLMAKDLDKISPSSYYSLWSKYGAATNKGVEEAAVNAKLEGFRSSSKTSDIFDIYARKANNLVTNVYEPTSFKNQEFIDVLNKEFVKKIND